MKDRITLRYLKKHPDKLLRLFFLGIPLLIWMYSIPIELHKGLKNKSKNLFWAKFSFWSIIIYFPLFVFGIIPKIFGGEFVYILGPHLIIMFFAILLIHLAADSIKKFELEHNIKFKNKEQEFYFVQLMSAPFYLMSLQAKLSEYVDLIERQNKKL